ncbi:uncharacterized protein K452DRAFT_301992 [Aplosporella prunicola CBS 121167]|uniref:NACHT domain-containing protein n=1 Tax=Aplosporella prunicola CBS 121167 TaxID=1176127 RepID=A0A6A6B322_9PEZI|nr:uncharacterized protein K452DRAFT_301992 [Aplosporella prunicola CBS 121167]KAF2137407.1 hypothetical protein K452DRAFT_301992 [Aplosporella prunicola CBS 121167]
MEAFAFAVNIIKVIDWGRKGVLICHDIFESGEIKPTQVIDWSRKAMPVYNDIFKSGKSNPTQREVIMALKNATDSLQESLSSQPEPLQSYEQKLLDIAQLCKNAATNLLKKLGNADGHSKMTRAMTALLKKSAIEKLDDDLASCQRALETQLLLDLRNNHDLTALRTDQAFDNLDAKVQNIILKLEDGKTKLSQILDNHTKIITKMDSQHAEAMVKMNRLEARSGSLQASAEEDHQKAVLASLFFPEITSRREQISEVYPDTYEWVFKITDRNSAYAKNPNLLQWLKNGNGIYWISGKVGSGKSTLIKYITEHPENKAAQASWAGPANMFIATHFFWSQGVTLQRSQEGFLRTILYQILKSTPNLMAFLDRPLKLCIFADGLDEYMGDPTELVKLLYHISSGANLKCVIGSRPWAAFRKILEASPQIRLQELTEPDILSFVSGKIRTAATQALLSEQQTITLTSTMLRKAEGVFLWVSLATASVLEGILNGDDFDELQSRVDELPIQLSELYRRILLRIDERYRLEAMRIFQILLLDNSNPALTASVLTLSLMDFGMEKKKSPTPNLQDDEDYKALLRDCNRTLVQLQQRCGGLLQFESLFSNNKHLYSNKIPENIISLAIAEHMNVRFLHKTVFDSFRESPQALELTGSHPQGP